MLNLLNPWVYTGSYFSGLVCGQSELLYWWTCCSSSSSKFPQKLKKTQAAVVVTCGLKMEWPLSKTHSAMYSQQHVWPGLCWSQHQETQWWGFTPVHALVHFFIFHFLNIFQFKMFSNVSCLHGRGQHFSGISDQIKSAFIYIGLFMPHKVLHKQITTKKTKKNPALPIHTHTHTH